MNLTTRKEMIQFGETKVLGIFKKKIEFMVEADIPDSVLKDYTEISNLSKDVESTENQKKAFDIMKKVIIGILTKCNKQKEVEKFVNNLGLKATNKIFIFLNEYINDEPEEKKND